MSICNYKLQSNVRLQPLVLFQIISSYERRPKSAKITVGTLLGRRDKFNDTIEITNSFIVHHKQRMVGEVEQFKLDTQFASDMFELNKRSCPQEKIIGWYSTGKSLSRSSSVLHAYYARECLNSQPINLLVDLTLRGGRLKMSLFSAVPIGVPGGTRGLLFTLLPQPELATEIDDSVALRLMQKHAQQPTKQLGLMPPELVHVAEATRELEQKLDLLLRYINDVLDRKRQPDNNVGRALHEALTSVPLMEAESFRDMFNSNVRDMLMGITLCTMIKTQMELTEKLSYLPEPL